jgi:hypothetical protein
MNRDFADMLSAADAEFLVVGAYATAAHGLPRATGDIDIWVRPTPENAQRTMAALRAFGAPLLDLGIDDLVRPDTVFQIGGSPARIDIMTGITGVIFEDAWSRRVSLSIDGQPVPVLGVEDLLRNKEATGRPKDLADAAWLRRRRD